MSIAVILVPVTGSMRDRVALATAFEVAKPFDAHVRVLFARADPTEAIPISEMPLFPNVATTIIQAQQEIGAEASKRAREALALAAEAAQVRLLPECRRVEGVTASYEEQIGRVDRCLELAAPLYDLIVFPPGAAQDPVLHDAFLRILTRSERPILLSAERTPGHVGTTIDVAWDGSVTAAHALTMALPYLRRAKAVNILSIQRSPKLHCVGEAKKYLSLHGIMASQCLINRGDQSVAELLLETVANSKCDLLVMGGYGRSHLQETLFGGVTRFVMSHPTVPVLMVH